MLSNGGVNGVLRSAFRGLSDQTATTQVAGNVTGAAGAKNENLTVDDEGNVKANPDKGKLLAPLLLAFTAAVGHVTMEVSVRLSLDRTDSA